MSQINDLLNDSQAQFRAQRNETKSLVTKWEATGLLEGIDTDYNKHNTAILLENQAKQLISESNSINAGGQAEDWNGVALPLVRRIFGEISAKEFVSVQPMNLPSGLVFWMDFKYGTTKGKNTKDDSLFGNSDKKGAANTASALYGEVRGESAGYSLGKKVSAEVTLVSSASTIALADADLDLAKSFYFVSNSVHYPVKSITTGNVATFDGMIAGAIGNIHYYANTATAHLRGDFEDKVGIEMGGTADGKGVDLEIPEIEVKLEQEALVAKTRKLKVKWSPEFAQDLNAYHSIDAEAELTSMLSEYISMEIDLEILSMLSENALTKEYWSATIGEVHTGTTTNGESDWNAGPAAAAYNQGTWFQTLGTKIQKVSNQIHAKTMRGGANFLVCGPEVATILESIPGYAADTDGNQTSFAMGVQKVGALNNRFTVYKNPYIQKDEILLGFRGTQFLETGAVYAPYVPLIMTPLVYDPNNFTPRKGVMTRYAKKVVRPEFYGKVFCKDLANV